MAFIRPFTDDAGNECPDAYWVGDTINISGRNRVVYLEFSGYRDSAAYAAGLKPVAGATKSYVIEGAEFYAIAAAQTIPGTNYDNNAIHAEAYALSKLDTPGPDGELVSFFDGADQV